MNLLTDHFFSVIRVLSGQDPKFRPGRLPQAVDDSGDSTDARSSPPLFPLALLASILVISQREVHAVFSRHAASGRPG